MQAMLADMMMNEFEDDGERFLTMIDFEDDGF